VLHTITIAVDVPESITTPDRMSPPGSLNDQTWRPGEIKSERAEFSPFNGSIPNAESVPALFFRRDVY